MLKIMPIIVLEKSLATLDCFTLYFVNDERMESCCIGLETTFVFEEFCMNFFVVVAVVAE